MPADQAIFTSLARRGKAGYHLVAKSPGVSESEAHAVATWSPSHGALCADDVNRHSVNFFGLPSGRYAVARTREGRGEYSGRGRQLFTRVVIVDALHLKAARYRVFDVYRDALALGHLTYDPNPSPILPKVELSRVFPPRDPPAPASDLKPSEIDVLVTRLASGRGEIVACDGDRAAIAEHMLAQLPEDAVLETSFATNLRPSSVRPYRLCLVGRA